MEGSCVVKKGEIRQFLLDAGVETSGYPVFRFQGGAGSRITIIYFEKFIGDAARSKIDAEKGEIYGITDTVCLDGTEAVFEPFWYRTFRFVSIEVYAKEDTVVYAPFYRKTGYPLKAESWLKSSESWVGEVWELCVRTLENCMTETYMDCPYYEQNQFPMDTRLQALFCSVVSRDSRLTMKALEDFHCSITPDGLVHGRYPASYLQIISTFSLHYIYMLEETWQQSRDISLFRRYLPDLDRILNYYDARIGEDGLVGRLGFWEFVDWKKEWDHLAGAPAAGRSSLAEEYRTREETLLNQIRKLCWDPKREMFREGPKFLQYTQHAQSFAVLTGAVRGDEAKKALQHAMEDEDVLKVSFSTSYEWFRALESAGLYEKTRENMAQWAALPAAGNTTCPETPEDSRSECGADPRVQEQRTDYRKSGRIEG